MRPSIIPSTITQAYFGLSRLGLNSLIPAEYQSYLSYLDPADHVFTFKKGRIDVTSEKERLVFDVRGVRATYAIPEKSGFPRSELSGKINARIALKGDNEKGKYSSVDLSGTVKGYTSILGGASSGATEFSTNDIGVDIQLNGLVKINQFDSTEINLDSVQLTYTRDDIVANLQILGNVQIGRKKFRADIRNISIDVLSSQANVSWSADVNINPAGGFTANFKENSAQVVEITSDSASNLTVSIADTLLQRFNISDEYINNIIQGRTVTVSGQQFSSGTATLGQAGNNLTPAISFIAAAEVKNYSVEDVVTQFLGVRQFDIRLLDPSPAAQPAPIALPDNASSGLTQLKASGTGALLTAISNQTDTITFNLQNFKSSKPDIITGFDPDEDSFLLPRSSFAKLKNTKLTTIGTKKASLKSKKGFNKTQLVYNQLTGHLIYDENGKKGGLGKGGIFAQLGGDILPALSSNDFIIS